MRLKSVSHYLGRLTKRNIKHAKSEKTVIRPGDLPLTNDFGYLQQAAHPSPPIQSHFNRQPAFEPGTCGPEARAPRAPDYQNVIAVAPPLDD